MDRLASRIRDSVGPLPAVDIRTTLVIFIMTGGIPALVWLHHAGHLPLWTGIPAACLLMNFSFTAWHEPSHGNFSSKTWLNNAAGWIASLASVYPGYFARRQEHLIHHLWEGIEGKDPVYPRIQTTFWKFPWRLMRLMLSRAPQPVPPALVLTPLQKFADAAAYVLAIGAVAASIRLDFWPSLVALWILPRFAIFWLHAYYICFFPHAVGGGGYTVARIRESGSLIRFVTMLQNLHGIHHRWPFIPWHRYGQTLKTFRAEIEREGVQFVR